MSKVVEVFVCMNGKRQSVSSLTPVSALSIPSPSRDVDRRDVTLSCHSAPMLLVDQLCELAMAVEQTDWAVKQGLTQSSSRTKTGELSENTVCAL